MAPAEHAASQESFIRTARREQLVACAIAVIADVGYEKASTVLIAQRTGVSRGVLTYHFRDRADLIAQVVRTVYELGVREVLPAVRAAADPRAALLTFVARSVEFYAAYPQHMAALGEIFNAGRHTDAPTRPATPEHTRELADVRTILRAGQREGRFRDFDTDLMTSIVRATLDASVAHLTNGGSVEAVRDELVRTIDAATRKEDQ